jgi:hypothetical protein
LSVAEVCEDLTESLMDRVVNGGLDELHPYLDNLPQEDDLPAEAPADKLVQFMEDLLKLEADDPNFRSAAVHDALHGAISELRRVARGAA